MVNPVVSGGCNMVKHVCAAWYEPFLGAFKGPESREMLFGAANWMGEIE